MSDQSMISCPSCGKKIPLTRALRAEIEASLKQQFDETLQDRERELRATLRVPAGGGPAARAGRCCEEGGDRESRRNSLN